MEIPVVFSNPTSKVKLYFGITIFVVLFVIGILLYRSGKKKGETTATKEAEDKYVPIEAGKVAISIQTTKQYCADVQLYFNSYYTYLSEKETLAKQLLNLPDDDLKFVNNYYNKYYKKTDDSFFVELKNEIFTTSSTLSLINRLQSLGITN